MWHGWKAKRQNAAPDTLPAIIRIDPKTGINVDRLKAASPANDDHASAIVVPKVRSRRDLLAIGETDQAAAARYRALIISKLSD